MKINRQIRADKVRLIDKEGKQAGIVSLRDALNLAEQDNLDLVEIAPNANPPVCKIVDYGKLKYQQMKKEKESKKARHLVKVKEIKFKPNIDTHDFMTKAKHAKDFIEKGFKVRITCFFRGREILHSELGEKVIQKVCDELKEIAVVEAPLKRVGRTITTVLAPVSKKK